MSKKKEKKDSVGDRMKRYENVSRSSLLPRTPVIVRVDGRAFHTYTRGMERPYDKILQNSMVAGAVETANEMSGFKIGFIQSDEASFLMTDWDTLDTQCWFDNDQQKLSSLSASLMTAHFNVHMNVQYVVAGNSPTFTKTLPNKLACFDGRSFNIPFGPEIVNYFLWRAKDWERNSLSMYARSFFSSKELHGKKKQDMHDMLHGKGKNWTTDVDERSRNGSFFFRNANNDFKIVHIPPSYPKLAELISPLIGLDLTPKPVEPSSCPSSNNPTDTTICNNW